MINQEKMELTNQAYFMHCLPVRRNVIVSDQVIDSPNSLVIQQAANRVISMQTVLSMLLEQKSSE
jgi:N-succinyl-L-ornithine transcarbamylase